jgi:hypothetical protein
LSHSRQPKDLASYPISNIPLSCFSYHAWIRRRGFFIPNYSCPTLDWSIMNTYDNSLFYRSFNETIGQQKKEIHHVGIYG